MQVANYTIVVIYIDNHMVIIALMAIYNIVDTLTIQYLVVFKNLFNFLCHYIQCIINIHNNVCIMYLLLYKMYKRGINVPYPCLISFQLV
jgi:hypothetical protein